MSDEPRSTKRKGKRIKSDRSTAKSSAHNLDNLYRIFYEIKVSEGRAKATLKQYEDNFGYFTKYLDYRGIDRNVSLIKREVIRDYIRYMRSEIVKFEDHQYKTDEYKTEGLSVETINTRLKTLRVMFGCLHEEGYILDNPMQGVKNIKPEESEIIVLDETELRLLINAPITSSYAEFRDYVLMHVLIDGMMRISEAVNLRIQDFDLRAGFVTIPAPIAKNRKARTISLQERTAKLVRELHAENKADFDSDYVFLTNYGEPITRDHFRLRLKMYGERAGIKKRIHPHLLRHTSATMFLENGGDIRHLQMILGHSDLRMVQRYTHLSQRSIKTQQDNYSPINNIIGKLNKPRKTRRR